MAPTVSLPPPPALKSAALRDAWIAFLSPYRWEWIGTFTFRDGAVHPERADKLFRVFISKANRDLFGPRWARKGVGISWARGLEYQRRGTIHYHALLSGTGALRRWIYKEIWFELAGIARIEQPRFHQRVLRYITKYVVKDGEIDLGGPWFNRRGGPVLPFAERDPARLATPEPAGADGGAVCRGLRRTDTASGAPS